jgi:hypothetical protein
LTDVSEVLIVSVIRTVVLILAAVKKKYTATTMQAPREKGVIAPTHP